MPLRDAENKSGSKEKEAAAFFSFACREGSWVFGRAAARGRIGRIGRATVQSFRGSIKRCRHGLTVQWHGRESFWEHRENYLVKRDEEERKGKGF